MTGSHPDDESLSAAIDGEDDDAAAHLAACTSCLARSDSLAGARSAVATPPPAGATPGLADRAVAAALAAYAADRVASSPTSPAGDDGVVVPLRAPAAGLPDSFTSRGTSTPRRGRRVPPWVLGAAAALVAVLVAVPLVTRDTGGRARQTASAPSGAGAKAAVPAGVVGGGDLGDQSDQLALGTTLAAATGGGGPPAGTAGDQASTGAGEARAATPSQLAGGAVEAAPGPATTSPPPSVTAAAPAATSACEDTVRSDFAQGLGPLLYRATLRWQGTPAVVLVYRLADTGGGGRRAFVMALDGCRILVVQPRF